MVICQLRDFSNLLEPVLRDATVFPLCPSADIQNLPAIQWKLHNIGRMEAKKREGQLADLRKFL